jgi:carboxymethylenebutenolidase
MFSVCTFFVALLPLIQLSVQFLEVQAQHAFIRDEQSKGRWDGALTRSLFSFMMEVFERTVGRDLGLRVQDDQVAEHVC